jgi:hypothetical protein
MNAGAVNVEEWGGLLAVLLLTAGMARAGLRQNHSCSFSDHLVGAQQDR